MRSEMDKARARLTLTDGANIRPDSEPVALFEALAHLKNELDINEVLR